MKTENFVNFKTEEPFDGERSFFITSNYPNWGMDKFDKSTVTTIHRSENKPLSPGDDAWLVEVANTVFATPYFTNEVIQSLHGGYKLNPYGYSTCSHLIQDVLKYTSEYFISSLEEARRREGIHDAYKVSRCPHDFGVDVRVIPDDKEIIITPVIMLNSLYHYARRGQWREAIDSQIAYPLFTNWHNRLVKRDITESLNTTSKALLDTLLTELQPGALLKVSKVNDRTLSFYAPMTSFEVTVPIAIEKDRFRWHAVMLTKSEDKYILGFDNEGPTFSKK